LGCCGHAGLLLYGADDTFWLWLHISLTTNVFLVASLSDLVPRMMPCVAEGMNSGVKPAEKNVLA
tara:strand:+ start:307 stop:501 length:195 start_codon:yes stop_codon:yes gene_type:complete